MTEFTIERLEVPLSLDMDAPQHSVVRDFVDSVEVRNASEVRAYGTPEVAYPAVELLPNWLDPHEPKVLWVARLDGRIAARAVHESQLDSAADIGWIDIDVHPDAERRGIGRALADLVEGHARSLGQSRLICYAVSPPLLPPLPAGSTPPGSATPPGPGSASGWLVPPTGFGGVPTSNREVRFLLARGYRLEQVERASRFALPGDAAHLATLRSAAEAAAGPDYRVHLWAGATPPEWLADLATLLTRMSTDAPTAGLDEPEDVWTPERVAAHDARSGSGARQTLTAAVEHLPTGRLAAFSQLSVPLDRSRPVSQDDTLVLSDHRGHRLGMLVKVANLELLARVAPGHPSVLTWNAEENRHMLSVNEAVGFTAIGYEGAWRLDF
ncbi:GNAT family N-acetyltransferase [Subtercola sp. YIM 133946]|uniref:GNAT family N-acetyltransferase n=1 Tax=Subtercola sp. YIM 133946 TaxID=3118909 RepID=UPI002F92BF4A